MGLHTHSMDTQSLASQFSPRYRFADWPNHAIPSVASGVYAIWHEKALVYFGMSGREIERVKVEGRQKEYGLVTRLRSHWSGRLSGDQFCVYVANRLVIPNLDLSHLSEFASGRLTLDALTRAYIHRYFDYQYLVTETSAEAFRIEASAKEGEVFGQTPLLNPAMRNEAATGTFTHGER